MDFGTILKEWELAAKREKQRQRARIEPAPPKIGAQIDAWLDSHGVENKDAAEKADRVASRARERRRLSAMAPQDSIDLHGLSAAEAEDSLRLFLESAARRGLDKVLVIHGKGNHSTGAPVLKKTARVVIEASPWAGGFGEAEKSLGGSGALWVEIRRKKL